MENNTNDAGTTRTPDTDTIELACELAREAILTQAKRALDAGDIATADNLLLAQKALKVAA